jgi:hypothetical protein
MTSSSTKSRPRNYAEYEMAAPNGKNHLITKAPRYLGHHMSDPTASPRHRVDAIRTLDSFTGGPGNAAPAGDRFLIQINLGSDTLKFDKSRAVDPHDIDPNETPMLAARAAKKPTESDGRYSLTDCGTTIAAVGKRTARRT